jgi:hypothetical protein
MRILLRGASGLAGGILWSHVVAAGHGVVGTQHSAGAPDLVRLDPLDDVAPTDLALGPFDLVVDAAGLVDLVPAEAHGQTSVAAERLVLRDPRHVVLRIPMLNGASPFVTELLDRLARPRTLAQVDVVCARLSLPSLASGMAKLWDRAGGAEVVARFGPMSRIQAALGLASEVVGVRDDGDLPGNVRRPRRRVLRSERRDLAGPDLEAALAAWAAAAAG